MMLQGLKKANPTAPLSPEAPPSNPRAPETDATGSPDFIEIPENLSVNTPTGGLTGMQRLKDQGFYRQQYFKEAQCFECDHKFKVGRSSRSASCPACGAAISMEDLDLNMPSNQPVKTRGDVIIRKRGQLNAPHLFCRELRCFGMIAAEINCSGDAIFKTSGTIVGEVRCRRFIVEKGSEITFMNAIHADEVEIHAHITANVFSAGQVLISANGAVNGDVTARSVSIEPGGELNGAMNILRNTVPKAPPTTI
jgi:cytoskeletal protein CcmA (bactofilin family)